MRFAELLKNSSHLAPDEHQREAARQLPAAIRDSHLTPWSTEGIQFSGTRVVFCIAHYAPHELDLLDLLHDLLESIDSSQSSVRVEVFDVDDCQSVEDFDARIPQIVPYTTPMVGIWREQEFIESAIGLEARRLALTIVETFVKKEN